MRVKHTCVLALVALMAAGCALGRAKTEPKRIAVLEFKGAVAKKLQRVVADLVGKHHEVVSDKKYRRTARKLNARRMRARHVAKVAAKLGVDAVVEGRLVRRGKRAHALRIEVREGATGKTIGRYTIPVRKRRMSGGNRRKLESKLVGLLDEIDFIEQREGDGNRSARRGAPRKAKQDAKRKAKRDAKRKAKLRAERKAERRADRKAERKAERKAKRKAKRVAKNERKRRRKRPKRKRTRAERLDDELERNPVVFNDKVDDDGQFLDDEVPDNLK